MKAQSSLLKLIDFRLLVVHLKAGQQKIRVSFVLEHTTRKELQYIKLIDINMQVLTFFVKEGVTR